ncbi:MAG: hypothetical protein HUU19_14545 [Phycisphaerales bacterium]|nr:hypothetical protein [Phycisphaerales bacterium]
MPRRWTRTAALALLFVALGAATTTAVAWGIALNRTTRAQSTKAPSTGAAAADQATANDAAIPEFKDGFLFSPAVEYPGITELHSSRLEFWNRKGDHIEYTSFSRLSEGVSIARTVEQPPDGRHIPANPMSRISEYRFGWPARSYWYLGQIEQCADVIRGTRCEGLWFPLKRPTGSSDFKSSIGIQCGSSVFERWLPIYILPLGFTLNTLFYAAAWFTYLFGIRSIRRNLRTRRGLCTGCAYDLKGLPPGSPCPECGRRSAHAPSPAT